MAQTIYEYSISADTLNGAVVEHQLREEIHAEGSGVTISVDSISRDGDDLSIVMADILPDDVSETSASLAAVVAAHDGIVVNPPQTVVTHPDNLSTELGLQEVIMHKPDMSSFTTVSHDFCDKTTWYSDSTQVTGKALTLDSGAVWDTGDVNLIDATHGKIYGEDSLTTNGQHYKVNLGQGYPSGMRTYRIKVYDDATELTEDTDFTVNYATGKIDFGSYSIQGTLTADYYVASTPSFVLKPKAGKVMFIEHAELQLSTDCIMDKPISFEVWVYHPDQATYPGVKIPYQMITYKNIKDILNACNKGKGYFPAMSQLTNDVVVLPFEYATLKPFRSSVGAELRITMEGTDAIAGEWGTATFYILSKDE